MELILVRHPRPVVEPGICYGRSDVGTAPEEVARVQARLAADGLPAGCPVFSSPLRRCADLALRLSPHPVFDADLAEMDFGTWELRHWDDIPRADVDAWVADLLRYRPGGGEAVLDVARRVAAALARISGCEAPRAIVVCHAGTMRLIAALATETSLERAALAAAKVPHRIGYGEVLRLAVGAKQA